MRTPRLIAALAFVLMMVMACHKSSNVSSPASFTIVHAMPTGSAIVPLLGPGPAQYFATMQQVYYGTSQLYSPLNGTSPLLVVPITDTNFKIFQGSFPLVRGGIYSFFLAGDTAHADTMLVKDNIPYITDSSVAIRFVNLSQGGKGLSVNLAGSAAGSEVSNLPYLHITDFKKYNATGNVGGSYQFEIRDQATGDSLTSFTWSYTLLRSNTLVISGSTDPTSPTPLMTWTINNY